MSHPCPAAGCQAVIRDEHLMCPAHWRRVPKNLQHEVYDSYRGLNSATSAADAVQIIARYRLARDAAVKAASTLPEARHG